MDSALKLPSGLMHSGNRARREDPGRSAKLERDLFQGDEGVLFELVVEIDEWPYGAGDPALCLDLIVVEWGVGFDARIP